MVNDEKVAAELLSAQPISVRTAKTSPPMALLQQVRRPKATNSVHAPVKTTGREPVQSGIQIWPGCCLLSHKFSLDSSLQRTARRSPWISRGGCRNVRKFQLEIFLGQSRHDVNQLIRFQTRS